MTSCAALHRHDRKMSNYSVENFLDRLSHGDQLIVKVDFAVKGTVTGVGFRRNVKSTADRMKLRGWVANSTTEKVIGTVEGTYEDVRDFKSWLALTGPRGANIVDVVFTNETWKPAYTLPPGDFNVVYKY